jgi:tetraacyldisaccharide-1-P 4'-kinase
MTKSASDKPIASITFETDAPIPANDAAKSSNTEPLPRVALTGTMKPNLFFDLAETWNPSITTRIALPDHGMLRYGQDRILQQSAGDGGVVMTEKDFCRLEKTLPSELKLWILPERLVWHSGQKSVWEHLRRVVPSPPKDSRSQTSI